MADTQQDTLPPPPPSKGSNFAPLDLSSSSFSSLPVPGASSSSTPASPMSPSGPESMEARQKRSNPLTDLIDTEKSYVEQLTGIIRKVAAAWSRSNLPPPELDNIFRGIEGVYKANRSLLAKLREIGTNPSSPKALGDLLMRWIDDLEVPYTSYCGKFCTGFDDWEPVQSNPRLPTVMGTFSVSIPPPTWACNPNLETPTWTLDGLFLLPKARLKYYRKLYSRLLKSTTPGRSDHKLLVGALDKLDRLLDTLDMREQIFVGAPEEPADTVVLQPSAPSIDGSSQNDRSATTSPRSTLNESVRMSNFEQPGGSETSSARGSSLSSGERLSRETANTSISRVSSSTMSMPISDLERRLTTERTLDIFTMRPKVVRLQMSPPTLHFTRELRFSVDALIRFTPRATGVEVVHRMGHLFLLSDLFLICERMSNEERSQHGSEGADMWLCYPPLAGKVLRVAAVEGQDNALEVAIMRKETLIIEAESVHVRNFMLAEFQECIAFASSLPPPASQPPPPLPPLPANAAGEQGSQRSLPGIPPDGPVGPGQNMPPRPSPSQESHPSASSSQPFFASPGQVVPPARSASYGSNMVNAGYRSPPPSGPMPGSIMPGSAPPSRPPSEPQQTGLHHSPSGVSLRSQYSQQDYPPPPMPNYPRGMPNGPPGGPPYGPPNGGMPNGPPPGGMVNGPGPGGMPGGPGPGMYAPQPRTMIPSGQLGVSIPRHVPSFHEPSPPNSPVEETPVFTGPVTSTISAEMKCKVFLKQHHAQWKSLGSAKLKLYRQSPTNVKQLVVETGSKGSILISTIVLSDGVERVGKTGVAIELSDMGVRTGIVYMIQLRTEQSAGGLFDSLIEGSDRTR
ncbi:unnamed protein product [Mycena citricolor]|uniref:DH domain-containing protein n=1 Tax=Mycena citricolor TaxID=2018698 RepID=A0AAD2Q653_9AGAR|nr:unnamed protein product [Mycena citricolor]